MDDFELEFVDEIPSPQEIAQFQQDNEQFEWENHRHNYYCQSLFDFI
jgi:hypothetical protein